MNPIVDIPKPAGNGLNIVDEWEPAATADPAANPPSGRCRHCRKLLGLRDGLIPTHDWPPLCRQVCPGSGKPPAPDAGEAPAGLNINIEFEPAQPYAGHNDCRGLLAADDGRRPDPHARRTLGLGGIPAPDVLACAPCGGSGRMDAGPGNNPPAACPDCLGTGLAFRPEDPAHAGGLVGRVSAGMADQALLMPDAPADPLPPATAHEWLSDAGRCELAAVYPLIARMQRECPGVCVRVAVSFAVSGLADGTGHTDVRPGWELAAWRGADVYSGRGHDLEQLAAFACARIGGARK